MPPAQSAAKLRLDLAHVRETVRIGVLTKASGSPESRLWQLILFSRGGWAQAGVVSVNFLEEVTV